MNSVDEYYIPVETEDERMRLVADKAAKLFKQNSDLERIFQKHIVSYNEALTDRFSVKYMHESHERILSSIMFIRASDILASDDSPSMVTSPRKKISPVKLTVVDTKSKSHLDTILSVEEVKPFERPKTDFIESISAEGKPETFTSSSVYDPDTSNLLFGTPQKHETMAFSPEEKVRTFLDHDLDETFSIRLPDSPSIFNENKEDKTSKSDNVKIFEAFGLERKPKTITDSTIKETDIQMASSKTPKKQQTMIASSKIDRTIKNDTVGDRFGRHGKLFDKSDKNEKEPCNIEIVPILSTEHKEVIADLYKTPDKFQTMVAKNERSPINPIVGKKAIAKASSGNQEFINPITDIKISNISSVNKRKSDNSVKVSIDTCSVAEEKKCVECVKMAKLDEICMVNKKTVDSALDEKVFLKCINDFVMDDTIPADSALNDKQSFKSSINFSIDDKEHSNRADDKSINEDISDVPAEVDVPAIKSASFGEKHGMEDSALENRALFLTPENAQKKLADDNTVLCNLKNDELNRTVSQEATDIKSLTSLMKNLRSPSLKRPLDGSSRKSMSDAPVGGAAKRYLSLSKSHLSLDIKLDAKTAEFMQELKQTRTWMAASYRLFFEDFDDLTLVYDYLNNLVAFTNAIPMKAYDVDLTPIIVELKNFAFKLQRKMAKWGCDIMRDLETWKDSYKRIAAMQEEIKQLAKRQSCNMTEKDFQNFEICLRAIKKNAGQMWLLRNSRRPTILHSQYRVGNLIKVLIQILLIMGLIKPSSKMPSH